MENVKDLKPIAAGQGVDLSEFEGEKSEIAGIEIREIQSKFTPDGKSKVLRVYTNSITTMKDAESKDIDVVASELFNLSVTEDGELGWSEHKRGKLDKFLKKMKCKHPTELVGKKVVVKAREKINPDNSTSTFLGFQTG